MSASPQQRTLIGPSSTPRLARHIRMRHDAARDRWMLLGPERVFSPDEIAMAVLKLCDGRRTVEEIAAKLARTYAATEQQILRDVCEMLQELADKSVVVA